MVADPMEAPVMFSRVEVERGRRSGSGRDGVPSPSATSSRT